jgi:hypothetical protein
MATKNSVCWIRDPSKKPSGGRGRNSNTNNSNSSNQNGNNRNTTNSGNNNNNSSGGRFGGRFRYCQIIRHREKDCRKKRCEQGGTGNNNNNNTNAPDTAAVCIEYEESAALVHMEMAENESKETDTVDTGEEDDDDVPEIPETLLDEVPSEEETEITNDKGEIYTASVPKIKVRPYVCMGFDQYRD